MELVGPFAPRHAEAPPLVSGYVHAWFQDLADDIDHLDGRLSDSSWGLTKDELIRARSFHQWKNGAIFALSRRYLRQICSHYSGIPADAVRFGTHSGGKPFMLGKDGEPAPFKFNISHSGPAFLAAFSLEQEVGADIECTVLPAAELIESDQICTGREIELLQRMASSQRASAFLQIWARKEAVAKGAGVGLSLPFSAIESLYPTASTGGLLTIVTPGDSEAKHPSSTREWQLFSPLPGVPTAAAIAVEANLPAALPAPLHSPLLHPSSYAKTTARP